MRLYAVSGILLTGAAIYLFYNEGLKAGSIINLRGLFSLSFVGGQGISCFKLSYLQESWHIVTWLCFFLGFISFWLIFGWACNKFGSPYALRNAQTPECNLIKDEIAEDKSSKNGTNDYNSSKDKTDEYKPCKDGTNESKSSKDGIMRDNPLKDNGPEHMSIILYSVSVMSLISLIAFIIEASVLRYIPLFTRGVPHAYSYFHISGLHYFTVMCVLVPALSVIYLLFAKDISLIEKLVLVISNLISFSVPILCVSRFQFIFAVMLAVICFLSIKKDTPLKKTALPAVLFIIPVYVVLTIARSHDIPYLNSIFEMRWNLPIFISQPYIYVANNYDNFNKLVIELPKHSMGLKMLFPFFALTGLKFIFPQLINFPLYTTKTELSTLTIFYDAYYDFNIAGVVILAAALSAAAYRLEKAADGCKNPIAFMFYGQFAVYFSFSFFTTWFSNPTTWFYLGVTSILYYIYNYYARTVKLKELK